MRADRGGVDDLRRLVDEIGALESGVAAHASAVASVWRGRVLTLMIVAGPRTSRRFAKPTPRWNTARKVEADSEKTDKEG
jgi:hypothetical protein